MCIYFIVNVDLELCLIGEKLELYVIFYLFCQLEVCCLLFVVYMIGSLRKLYNRYLENFMFIVSQGREKERIKVGKGSKFEDVVIFFVFQIQIFYLCFVLGIGRQVGVGFFRVFFMNFYQSWDKNFLLIVIVYVLLGNNLYIEDNVILMFRKQVGGGEFKKSFLLIIQRVLFVKIYSFIGILVKYDCLDLQQFLVFFVIKNYMLIN